MVNFKHILLCSAAACIAVSCAKTEAPNTNVAEKTKAAAASVEAPRASAVEISEVALSDVPQSVNAVVGAARPDFTITEVLKKVRDGRVYYDVEGELEQGDELEFDVLMTENGPEIVEIQRDLDWSAVPDNARASADAVNSDNLEIVRVIESTQTDGAIIYELFVAGHPSDPRFEVRVKDGVADVLASRWEH